MNGLDEFLKRKHLEHCLELGVVLNESEWVKEVLNKNLPPTDKLAYPSVNQWMNGDRLPDAKNIMRLYKVFGPEIMPYVGIELPPDLARLVKDWEVLPDDIKDRIIELAKKSVIPSNLVVPVAA